MTAADQTRAALAAAHIAVPEDEMDDVLARARQVAVLVRRVREAPPPRSGECP